MRNCHKVWKKKRKAEREALAKSMAGQVDELQAMAFFFKKHPDQAAYELERMRECQR